MLLYPQLLSGAIAQFPLTSSREMANVINLQEDGTRYLGITTNPALIRWQLTYGHLKRQEMNQLRDFFESTRGSLLTFTFLDPTGNLLVWSENLLKPFWEGSPQLVVSQLSGSVETAFVLGSSGTATLSQTLPCPSKALVCFSLLARSDQRTMITLSVSDASNRTDKTFTVDDNWTQYFVSQAGTGEGLGKTVEVSLAAGGSVQVTRVSLNAQPAPATYVGTRQTGGIKAQARFNQDVLSVKALDPDDFSCSVSLTARLD